MAKASAGSAAVEQIIPAVTWHHRSPGRLAAAQLNLSAAGPVDKDVVRTTWKELAGPVPRGPVAITWQQQDAMGAEGYRLDIERRSVTITYGQPAGAFHGFVTLAQLAAANDGRLPLGQIDDAPKMAIRGVTDDISRGQISTLANFKSIIRRLAYLKCSHYFMYMEDVFASRSEKQLGKYSDPIPLRELRELAAYGRKWFVQVRPIFNMLGHWEKSGALERFAPLMLPVPADTKWNTNFPQVLDPQNPRVRPMLAKLMRELVDCFGPGLFHAGGDEPMHLTEIYGKERAAKLYVEHYRWVHDELADLGCRMAMYSDVFTPIWGNFAVGVPAARDIPRDTLMVYWNYDPRRDMSAMSELMDLGFDVVVSPASSTLRRLYPYCPEPYENIQALLRQSQGREAGLLMSTWCDMGADNLRELEWSAYAINAQAAWKGGLEQPFDAMMETFYRQFFGLPKLSRKVLAPLHEHDKLFGLEGRRVAWLELWRDARDAFDPKVLTVRKHMGKLRLAAQYLRRQKPTRNLPAWRCLMFCLDRLLVTIEKILAVPAKTFTSREQARKLAGQYEKLATKIDALGRRHKQLWLATNRYSEWDYLAARYIDLAESLHSLARYARVFIRFGMQRKMLA